MKEKGAIPRQFCEEEARFLLLSRGDVRQQVCASLRDGSPILEMVSKEQYCESKLNWVSRNQFQNALWSGGQGSSVCSK
jgi:hypothetical protein